MQSSQSIANAQPKSIEDVRQMPMLIGLSPTMEKQQQALKQFLRKNLYQHFQVKRMSAKAGRIIRELFNAFINDTGLMPTEFQVHAETDKARAVSDYIAGMTDRYAIREHRRLFAVEEYL